MKKKNKKGMTLVELIVGCAVMSLIILAAAGALSSSLNSYKDSNKTSTNMQNATLLEEYLKNNLSKGKSAIFSVKKPSFATNQSGVYFHYDTEENLIVTSHDSDGTEKDIASISGITTLTVTATATGKDNTKRMISEYVITLPYELRPATNSSAYTGRYTTISGSVVLQNSTKTTLPAVKTNNIAFKRNSGESKYFCVYFD